MTKSIEEKNKSTARHSSGILGFSIYTLALVTAASFMQEVTLTPISQQFAAVIGGLAVWRYSWGLVHFCRSLIYRKMVFPALRKQAEAGGDHLLPPHIYLLLTSFRIHAETSLRV